MFNFNIIQVEKQGASALFGCTRRITFNVTCNVTAIIVLCLRKVPVILLFCKKWVPGLSEEDNLQINYLAKA